MQAPFEGVVRAHGSTVLRVCRALAGPHDADDAWSETFLSALRAWPDLPEDANVAGWLVTIALSPRQRECVTLHHVAGMRHTEVAVLLDISPAAARRASADGIAALRTTYRSGDLS